MIVEVHQGNMNCSECGHVMVGSHFVHVHLGVGAVNLCTRCLRKLKDALWSASVNLTERIEGLRYGSTR
jgi:predicted metal-dependent RNase